METHNQRLFDYTSFLHVGIGAAMGVAGLRPEAAGGAIVFINLISRDLGAEAPGIFGALTPDTWQNSVGDVIAAFFGYYVGRTRYELKAGPNANL